MIPIFTFISLSCIALSNSLYAKSDYEQYQDPIVEEVMDKFCIGRCGTIPYPSNTGFVTPDPIINSSQVWSFISEPDLHPMKIVVNTLLPGTSPGYIFVAPYGFSDAATYGQTGSLIIDNLGNPIWFRPLSSPNLMNTDFRVQKLFSKPVLTFWQGTLVTPPTYTNLPGGSSEPGSCYYILDQHYRVIRNVSAKKGFTSDIHEFLITPQDTALFLSTKAVPMDLTPFGGPADGYIQDFAIQEIDLRTNELIFFWDALENIPIEETFEPISSVASSGNVWDVYHLNSIGLTENLDDIVVSSRSTWTIYKINKPSKNIIWRLGGKRSDFTIEAGAEFSWQHDARSFGDDIITLFDDNYAGETPIPPGTPFSHGLILQLDFINMTAKTINTYFHNPNLHTASQGNLQSLANGNKFIGWGQSPNFSEFSAEGNTELNPSLNLLYDASIPSTNYSYRAYRHEWIGKPCYPPSIAVKRKNGQSKAYVSWNGTTETVKWEILAGKQPTELHPIITVDKVGFETQIPIQSIGPYFQVKAIDKDGRIIGVSDVIRKGKLKPCL